jgi:hypothetical protein
MRGSHCSHLGRYQFASPRSFILAGSRIERIRVASIRMAVARPNPNCFSAMLRVKAKMIANQGDA